MTVLRFLNPRVAPVALSLALLSMAGCATPTGSDTAREGAALADHAGRGVASALATTVYAPAKITYATVGSLVGGGAYLVSGGQGDVANAVISPAVRGDYILTPEHLADPNSIQFVGKRPVLESAEELVQLDALPDVAAARSQCVSMGPLPSVYFETGTAGLGAEATKALDRAAEALRDCPLAKVELRAFSDAMGSRDKNLELSQERAQAVRAYLMTSGVEAERLELLSFGEEQPASSNATPSGRAANRRVEVTLR